MRRGLGSLLLIIFYDDEGSMTYHGSGRELIGVLLKCSALVLANAC